MALSKDVVIRLLGDSSSAEKAIKAAADAAEVSVVQYRKAEREHAKLARAAELAARQQREAMDSVGRGAMVFGAVVAAGLALSTKAAVDWETAWAGVEKTVDGTPAEMRELEGALRELANTLPATHGEIAAVAEAAGQLGIARGDVVEFTKTAIAMGVSTNLSAEDAATGLARLSNIMGTSSQDVDRMGSTLVALGNAGASTEGEILDMALRIASAGRQAGMTEGEVLALANSMSSLGIEAEAGGTAISTVIKDINSAVLDGGDQLELYAQVAGTTSQKFAAAWRDDAAGALVTVVDGLARMQAQGENVNTVITDLGLDGIRTSDTLLRLSGDVDGVSESLALGNRAWAENDALMNEANKRYDTTASKIQTARNQITDAAIDIGGFLLPAVAEGTELVGDFARGFADLPAGVQGSVVVIGVLAATIGLVGGAALIAVPKIIAFRATMTTLAGASGAATSAAGRFGLFMAGPWGAAIGVATLALGGLITILGSSSRASEEAASYQRDLASALRESEGAIDDNVRALAAKRAEETMIGDSSLLEWAEKVGISLPTVTDALLGNRAAYDEVTGALGAYEEANRVNAAGSRAGAGALNEQSAGAKAAREAFEGLAPSMGAAVAENQRLVAAQEGTSSSAAGTATSMDSLATATGEVAGNSEDAATAAEKLAEILDTLNGPTLDMREATRDYQEAIDKAQASIEEHGKTLDQNTEEGRANADALDRIAQSAMEQANAIAANGGSYDQFRNSLETGRKALVDSAIAMGATEEQAWALADQILQIPEAHEVDVNVPTYGQVVQQLQDVHTRIAGLPPQTWTNVGVISAEAMAQLESVNIKTRTLEDGTVEVYVEDTQAEIDLNNLTRTRTAVIQPYIDAVRSRGGGMSNGPPPRAEGGSIWPGTFLVGEKGPELLQVGASGFVTPAGLTAQAIAHARHAVAGGAAQAARPGIPVGSYVAGRSSGSAAAPAVDLDRLAALIESGRALVNVERWESTPDQTPHENAEALSWLMTTRGG